MSHSIESHDLVFTGKAACMGAVAYVLLVVLLVCVFAV